MTIAVHKTEYSNNRTATFAPAGFANMQITNRLIGRRVLWLFAPLLKLWDQIYLCMSQLAVILFFVKRNTRPYLASLCLESCQKQWFEMYLFFGLRRPHSRTETGTNLPPITSLFVLNGKQISHFTATILSKQNCELSPLSWVSPTKQDADLSGQDFIRIIG